MVVYAGCTKHILIVYLSPPVRMHGRLVCITFRDYPKSQAGPKVNNGYVSYYALLDRLLCITLDLCAFMHYSRPLTLTLTFDLDCDL